MNEKNPNYETIKGLTIGQVSSNPLRRLLLPNGVRLHPRHGDDGGRNGSSAGSDEGYDKT